MKIILYEREINKTLLEDTKIPDTLLFKDSLPDGTTVKPVCNDHL